MLRDWIQIQGEKYQITFFFALKTQIWTFVKKSLAKINENKGKIWKFENSSLIKKYVNIHDLDPDQFFSS